MKIRLTGNDTPFNRLNEDEIKNPKAVITEFFEYDDNLKEIRADLWAFLIGFFSSDYAESLSRHDRNHYILFIERMEGLIEAAYILHLKQQEKQKNKI